MHKNMHIPCKNMVDHHQPAQRDAAAPQQPRSVSFSLQALTHCMHRDLLRRQEADSLTAMQFGALHYLAEVDGPAFQRDLEQHYSLSGATITALVQRMEQRGLITRGPVGGDARLKQLLVTDRGLALYQQSLCTFRELERQALRGVGPEELDIFYTCVDKITHNIESVV